MDSPALRRISGVLDKTSITTPWRYQWAMAATRMTTQTFISIQDTKGPLLIKLVNLTFLDKTAFCKSYNISLDIITMEMLASNQRDKRFISFIRETPYHGSSHVKTTLQIR